MLCHAWATVRSPAGRFFLRPVLCGPSFGKAKTLRSRGKGHIPLCFCHRQAACHVRPNAHHKDAFISNPLPAAEPQELLLGPRPQLPDQGRCSSPNRPTAGHRAAGVRPRSPATAPRPWSSFIPQPTYCGPPSRRSSPSVPAHSAPTKAFVHRRTHLLRAAEPQEFALGGRPQRPDQGRLSTPNSPTAGRRAAGVPPRSPATAPQPGQHAQHQRQRQRPRPSAR